MLDKTPRRYPNVRVFIVAHVQLTKLWVSHSPFPPELAQCVLGVWLPLYKAIFNSILKLSDHLLSTHSGASTLSTKIYLHSPHANPMKGGCYSPHFADNETELQRG